MRQVAPGVWRVRKSVDGERRSATFYGESIEDVLGPAQEWWTGIVQLHGFGGASTLASLMHARIERRLRFGVIKATSACDYHADVRRYVEPSIGGMDPASVTPALLNRLYEGLLAHGGRDGAGLSAASVRRVHAGINGCYRELVAAGVCASNPAASATVPRVPAPNPSPLDDVEREVLGCALADILATSPGPGDRAGIRRRNTAFAAIVALNTCAREGEVCALRRMDVSDGQVAVTGSVPRGGRACRVDYLKRGRGGRVSVAQSFLDELQRHYEWQATYLPPRLLESPACLRLPIVCGEDGAFLHGKTISYEFRRICDEVGLADVVFHDLRHTAATMLLSSGAADLATVSRRLHHARTSTTADVYTAALPAGDAAAGEAMARVAGQMLGGAGE